MKTNLTELIQHAAEVIAIASFVANLLPKAEVFDDYRRIKKHMRLS